MLGKRSVQIYLLIFFFPFVVGVIVTIVIGMRSPEETHPPGPHPTTQPQTSQPLTRPASGPQNREGIVRLPDPANMLRLARWYRSLGKYKKAGEYYSKYLECAWREEPSAKLEQLECAFELIKDNRKFLSNPESVEALRGYLGQLETEYWGRGSLYDRFVILRRNIEKSLADAARSRPATSNGPPRR